MSASWVLVDSHQCTVCGYLNTSRDEIMKHLNLHDREATPEGIASNTGECEAEAMLPSVGDVWEWEPLKRHARQTVTVTEVKWNGDEWWIESDGLGGRHWNSASRWVEATVLVRASD